MLHVKYKPNKKAFKFVCEDMELGKQLTLEHIGSVFGAPFYEIIIYALMDSQLAARAIQGAISRLRSGDGDVEERS